ncbi:lytic transglycosylase domain-containing protein, partial [Candidatus Saccharibacteria bacterium]|nr:lytic transglycosylase domain-containing protein [Candidatus Saccharibacteria bacterium]
MSDTQKFQTVFANLKMAESDNQHTDQYGNLIRSKAGAEGITQLMPATASNPGFGVEPAKDKSQAEYERVGRELLQAFVKRYDGDYEKALAAYNAGPGNVDKAIKRAEKEGGNWKDYLPKPEETLPYIDKILGRVETKPEGIEGSVEGARRVKERTDKSQANAEGVEEDMPPPFGPIRTNIKWQSLKEDPSWLDASELIYRFYYGKPFEGTDEELAEWGLQFMADLDWSLVTLGKVANKLGDLTDLETKMALSYMIDTFDNVDLSAGGVWRGVKA